MNIIETEAQFTSGVYAKQPIAFVRGQGATLWDADGVEYLDCSSGHGVANLGHANPKVAASIFAQANQLITLFESFPNDKRAQLMAKLTSPHPRTGACFLLQFRHRKRGSGHQVRAHFHRPQQHDCRHALFPRPYHGRLIRHLE